MSKWIDRAIDELTPELPAAPSGWRWEPVVWRGDDDVDEITFHAKWKLTRIEGVQE
jgi:hypothetical protein